MGITSGFLELFGGVQWTNPITAFGDLSGVVLESSIIAILCFFAAGAFIYLYYKKFYSVGEIPRGWKFFFIGLMLSALYQLMKIPFTYNWIYGDFFILLFLIFQMFAVGVLVYGLYLLKKEVAI
ncbi:MAG: hypothetical protein PHU12_02630 [Candidatus Aenigmarchaeota archaeon]|nr:hypothetical protein [Candidatus Aenigmarchaeota archaeon]